MLGEEKQIWAVVGTQWVEWSLPITEIYGSNLVISLLYLVSTVLKRRKRVGPFLMQYKCLTI